MGKSWIRHVFWMGSGRNSCLLIWYRSTLWLFNIAMENGPFIDGLPINSMVIFHGYVSHNQMVYRMSRKNHLSTKSPQNSRQSFVAFFTYKNIEYNWTEAFNLWMTNHDAINVWSVSSASAEATDWIRSSLLILFVGFATLASLICKIPQMVIWMIFQKMMDYSCGNLGQSGKPNVVCKTNASCFSVISIFMFENSVLPFLGEVSWFYPSLPLQSLISLWMSCLDPWFCWSNQLFLWI